MAAYRNGITTVILPADNEKDLEEIDQTVRAGLRFVTVEQVDAVLADALSLNLTCGDDEQHQVVVSPAGRNERPSLKQ